MKRRGLLAAAGAPVAPGRTARTPVRVPRGLLTVLRQRIPSTGLSGPPAGQRHSRERRGRVVHMAQGRDDRGALRRLAQRH